MHILLQILVLLSCISTLHSSRTPRLHRNDAVSPQEFIEVTTPLPFDNLIPSCSLPILSYDFGNTTNQPPVSVSYSAPQNCTWAHVALEIHFASQGQRHNRIGAVWLDGAELIRTSTSTSTAEPTADGIFWNVRKDVTRYSSLLAQDNLTLSVMLENIVDEVSVGILQVNVTFFYYDADAVAPLLSLPSDNPNSFNPYDKPADLIIPISAGGDEGYWFRIQKGSEIRSTGVKVPANTYKAVVEIYVSFHGNDEFWYSNPPDSYIEMNKLNTERGHGAYRDVLLTIDGNLVGSVVPFPVIYSGGINPLFWQPIVSIGAFNLPTYDLDVTPFLGWLLDGNVHYFGLGIPESISFWLVDANLHLWLDDSALEVQAGVDYKPPYFSTHREYKFEGLDGSFEVETKRKSEVFGWVNSTAGNFTTYILHEMEFKNEVKFINNGKRKTVEQKVQEKREVKVLSGSGGFISGRILTREYPLKITSDNVGGVIRGTYLATTELENALVEKKSVGIFQSELTNKQQCKGWMFVVEDDDVVSGAANTQQNYEFKDGNKCYRQLVAAYNGKILSDSYSLLCASPL